MNSLFEFVSSKHHVTKGGQEKDLLLTDNAVVPIFRFPLQVGRRQEAVGRQPADVEIHLLDRPRLLYPPLVVHRAPVSEQRHARLPAVRDVDAVHVPVVSDCRLHGGLPERGVVALVCGLHPDQLRVLEVDQEAGSLAEVAPHLVVDQLGMG